MNSMLHIGGVSPESVKELRAAINDILASGAEQKTLRAALLTLSKGCQVNVENTTVSNCNFRNNEVAKTGKAKV